MQTKPLWMVKRRAPYWDWEKSSMAEAFELACPNGHPLIVRARPTGVLAYAEYVHCESCPKQDGEYPKIYFPTDLS